MKHDAVWFYNFFNSRHNWCTDALHENGNYCAIGHLNVYEGRMIENFRYGILTVQECEKVLGNEIVAINDIDDNIWHSPKDRILAACRHAIKLENPYCELGKEYDV